jgi:hypothetical protein
MNIRASEVGNLANNTSEKHIYSRRVQLPVFLFRKIGESQTMNIMFENSVLT